MMELVITLLSLKRSQLVAQGTWDCVLHKQLVQEQGAIGTMEFVILPHNSKRSQSVILGI